jgi:AraC-like DNA-binding protein
MSRRKDVRAEKFCALAQPAVQFDWTLDTAAQQAGTGAIDGYTLLVNREHTLVIRLAEQKLTLQPGDACVLDAREPFTTVNPVIGRISCIHLRRRAFRHIVPGADEIGGRRIARQTPALILLIDYLDTVDRRFDNLQPHLRALVVSHVHDLAALVLAGPDDVAFKSGNLADARLRAIKRDIAVSIGRRDLDIATVAARHRMSPRSLQRLFEREDTTFTAHLLELRLNNVHRLLRDGRHLARGISELALDCGFGDMSHFNHAFRRRFNASPTQIRGAAQAR